MPAGLPEENILLLLGLGLVLVVMRWLGDEGAEKTNLTLDLIDSTTETSQKQMRTHFKKLYKILNADISYFVCLKLK